MNRKIPKLSEMGREEKLRLLRTAKENLENTKKKFGVHSDEFQFAQQAYQHMLQALGL